MPITKRIQTNFAKGELSPKVEGRPDLAAYFEGAAAIENFILLAQGGLTRRVGTRFIASAKYNDKDAILIPFEANITNAYIIEVGHLYMRFYKNKQQIQGILGPLEIVSPYEESNLRTIHYTQSVDVLFLFHSLYRQRRLSRISDTEWILSEIIHQPPPSFVKDTDISDSMFAGPGPVIPADNPGAGSGSGIGGSGNPGGGGSDSSSGGDGGGGDGGGSGDGE